MNLSERELAAMQRAVALLEPSRRLFVVTGAGISAESGLPTYRGIGGLYNVDDTDEGQPIEVMLSGGTFRREPELTWKYLAQIERSARGAEPNRAHKVLCEMEAHFEGLCILTQNVDGLHRKAGSQNIIDIHGDLYDIHCTSCHHQRMVKDYGGLEIPPRCPHCHGILRPRVVLFGELLPSEKVDRLYRELDADFDLVLTIGTTSVFPYIAAPVTMAKSRGIPTIEVNPGMTEVSGVVDLKLSMPAGVALDAIWDLYRQRHGR